MAYLVLDATQTWGGFPRSIFIIDALICTVVVGASRFWERAFVRGVSSVTGRGEKRRTLIVGAGRGGRSLLRELRETQGEQVVGFVDDDARLLGRRLQGVPVLGGTGDIEQILSRARPWHEQLIMTHHISSGIEKDPQSAIAPVQSAESVAT